MKKYLFILILLIFVTFVSAASSGVYDDARLLGPSVDEINNLVNNFIKTHNFDILIISSDFLDYEFFYNDTHYNSYLHSDKPTFLIILSKEGAMIIDKNLNDYSVLTESVKDEITKEDYVEAVNLILTNFGKSNVAIQNKKTSSTIDFNWLSLSLVIAVSIFILFMIILIFKLKKHKLMNQNYNSKLTRRQF